MPPSGPSSCTESLYGPSVLVPRESFGVTFAETHYPQAPPSKPIEVKTQVTGKALLWVRFQPVPREPPAWDKRKKTPDKHRERFIDSPPCSSGGGETKCQASLAEDPHPTGAKPGLSNAFPVLLFNFGSAAGHLPVLLSTEIDKWGSGAGQMSPFLRVTACSPPGILFPPSEDRISRRHRVFLHWQI